MASYAVAAAATTLVSVSVNVATGGSRPWLPAIEARPLWWVGVGTAVVAIAGPAGWWAQARAADAGDGWWGPADRRPVLVARARHGPDAAPPPTTSSRSR
ncbi:hypothetical protein ACFXGA_21380 [Actinosynnema sp. NPDC059335]|uniref:hypothetical protein n=1 Tax=Actinosynnema sp. NPDC059335 TaxID=3346804 RepID=UPI00366F65B2